MGAPYFIGKAVDGDPIRRTRELDPKESNGVLGAYGPVEIAC